MNDAHIFYVYVLFDHTGEPRYVGKGKNGRWKQHEAVKGRRPFVEETLAVLGELPKIKLHQNLSEFDAYRYEQALIEAIGIHPSGPLTNRTAKGSGPNSDQVKKWHASRSPEERAEHMRPAIEASKQSPVSLEVRRRTIKIAQASLTPEHHLTAAARLNANYTKEQRASATIKREAAITPEQRAASTVKRLATMTPEMWSAIGIRRNEFITAETRSEIGRKRSAHLTSEQRAENAKFLIGSQTREQLQANSRKGQEALTPEIRSEASRKRAATLGPEKLREISMKAVMGKRKKKLEQSLT